MDISVTAYRKRGEKRSGYNFTNPKPEPFDVNQIEVFRPFPVAINHRKHAGKIYRAAVGGVDETFARVQGKLVI